jgi:hypothetical protein
MILRTTTPPRQPRNKAAQSSLEPDLHEINAMPLLSTQHEVAPPPLRRPRGQRRPRIDPSTCERDYSDEEIHFMLAMDQYKRDNRRPFPTWSESLEVLRALGYRKVAEPTALPGLPLSAPAKEE